MALGSARPTSGTFLRFQRRKILLIASHSETEEFSVFNFYVCKNLSRRKSSNKLSPNKNKTTKFHPLKLPT